MNGIAGDQGAKGGATIGCCHPESESIGKFEQGVHVLQGGATIGETGASEEALEEAEDEKTCEAVDYGGGNGENQEDEESDYVNRAAAYSGNLAQRCEEQGADAVSQDVEGQGKGSIEVGNAEMINDSQRARSVNCRSRVDGKGI